MSGYNGGLFEHVTPEPRKEPKTEIELQGNSQTNERVQYATLQLCKMKNSKKCSNSRPGSNINHT